MLKLLLDWSEVWALLIPIGVYWFRRQQPGYMRPIIIYLFLAAFLNLFAEVMGFLALKYRPPVSAWWYSNHPFYNAQIPIRFLFFLLFFYALNKVYRLWVWVAFVLFLMGMFALEIFTNESVLSRTNINVMLQVIAAFLLMLLCIFFYLRVLSTRMEQPFQSKSFYQVTAIAVYCILTLFVFLFYEDVEASGKPSDLMKFWDYHNGPFIISCIFTEIALYVSA